MRVWVYYNPTTREAVVYEDEPPDSFGRRRYDIGPIELDEELVKAYTAAKETWHAAHLQFVTGVRIAQDQQKIDWSN